MPFGLSKHDLDYVVEVIGKYPEVKKALIFGSRAIGNYKKGSDVDIALYGDEINFSTVARIKEALQEESPMPYLFDIVDLTHSTSAELSGHVRENGIAFFIRN